jgi:hypothetical protein
MGQWTGRGEASAEVAHARRVGEHQDSVAVEPLGLRWRSRFWGCEELVVNGPTCGVAKTRLGAGLSMPLGQAQRFSLVEIQSMEET